MAGNGEGACLRMPHGRGQAATLPLHRDGPTIFGRGAECDHRLPGRFISRRHFVVVPDAEGFLLFDLGSRNGTYVRDRLARIGRLREGEVVRAGNRILIFESGQGDKARCTGCGRPLPGDDLSRGWLCLVCRHRYPLLEQTVSGAEILAPLDDGPGVADYLGVREEEHGEIRVRVLERALPRKVRRRLVEVRHPHLMKVHSVEFRDGGTVLLTELPRRVRLANLVQTKLPVPTELVRTAMTGVALALDQAHEGGLRHGALNPRCIGIDPCGEAVLDDLGLGEVPAGGDSETDWHVAPERRGSRKRVERVDDIYAFGSTFYEVLTRRPPMPDFASGEVDATRPLKSRRPDLPARLAYVVGRSLASDPKERYSSFDEILQDLG